MNGKKRIIIVSIAFVIMVVLMVVGYWSRQRMINEERAIKSEALLLENKIETVKVTLNHDNEVALESAKGVSTERLASDKVVIENLFKKIFTFNDSKSYQSIREMLIRDYKLKAEDKFMKTVYPENKVYTARGGAKLNDIDVYGLTLDYSDCKLYLNKVNGDNYTYNIIVTTSSTSKKVTNRVEGQILVNLTVDKFGNISDISGYTIK